MTTGIAIVDDPKGVAAKRVVAELDQTLFACWRDKKAGLIVTSRTIARGDGHLPAVRFAVFR